MTTYSTFRKFVRAAVSLLTLVLFLSDASADAQGNLDTSPLWLTSFPAQSEFAPAQKSISSELQFRDEKVANLRQIKLTSELRIRGWKISDKFYVGHTKVANRWGVGVLVEHRGLVFGVNNRGVQILKRF